MECYKVKVEPSKSVCLEIRGYHSKSLAEIQSFGKKYTGKA